MKLKKICMIWVALLGCLLGHAQDEARVASSLWGVQGSTLNVWGYNELRLADAIALRSELGLGGTYMHSHTIFGGYSRYGIRPELTVEPRYYYDLVKRHADGKPTVYNSGNYFSLRSSFYPEGLAFGNTYDVPTYLTVIPMWGLRRHFDSRFSVEASVGAGLRHVFGQKVSVWNGNEFVINWQLRVGYTF
jgi:hypothetical protein